MYEVCFVRLTARTKLRVWNTSEMEKKFFLKNSENKLESD